MSTINKSLMGFVFSGTALVLASASWKNNVRVIYGFNAGGDGYTSFKPSSNFNSLTQLQPDGVYIVDSATTGYDILGAVLATTGSPAALTVSKALLGFMYSDTAALVLASAPWKNNVRVLNGFNSAGTGYISFKPSSNFNSLTQLVKDAVYILDSATTGFSIPGGTVTSTVTPAPAPTTFSSYMPAANNWLDGTYQVAEPSGGGIIRNTFASVSGTTSASKLRLTLNAAYNGALGLFVNGQLQRLSFPLGTTSPLTINLPGTTSTIRLLLPDVARGTVGTSEVKADALVDVEAIGAITWQTASAPVRRVVFAGDSITDGGLSAEPFTQAFAVLVRDALAQSATAARLTVDGFSGGSLQDVYGPTAYRLPYRQRLYAQLDGTGINDLVLFYGTNDAGRAASTGAQYAANYAALLDAIHAERPDVNLCVVTPFPVTAGYAALLESDYRVPLRQVLAARPWAMLAEGSTLVNASYLVDGVHFNTAGHSVIANGLLTLLGITVPGLSSSQIMKLDANKNALSLLELTTNLSDPEYSFNGSAWQASNAFNVRNVVRGDYEIKVRSQSVPTRLRTKTVRVGQTYFVNDSHFTLSPNWTSQAATEAPFNPRRPGANDAQHYVQFPYDGVFEIWNRQQPNVHGMMLQKQDGALGSTPFGVSVPGGTTFDENIGLCYTHAWTPAEGSNVMRWWGDPGDPASFFSFVIQY